MIDYQSGSSSFSITYHEFLQVIETVDNKRSKFEPVTKIQNRFLPRFGENALQRQELSEIHQEKENLFTRCLEISLPRQTCRYKSIEKRLMLR